MPAESYSYAPNVATSGNTSLLEQIAPALSSYHLDYVFDAGGYLSQFEEINDPTTLTTIDYTFDAAGQMSFVDHDSNKDASMQYDGRGFLAELAIAHSPMLEATYSSEGVLHSLLRTPSVFQPSERVNVLFFAGRPIGIWKKVGTSTATLTRIVTDHLGTPAASIQQAGSAVDWYGGFEPFGEDWQAGTGQDSLAKGIFLRMPGQWKDPLWSTATYPMELFYNVHRWYETGTGRYLSVDPLNHSGVVPVEAAQLPPRAYEQRYWGGMSELSLTASDVRGTPFAYGAGQPTRFIDPLGLEVLIIGKTPAIVRAPHGRRLMPSQRYDVPRSPRVCRRPDTEPHITRAGRVPDYEPVPRPLPWWWHALDFFNNFLAPFGTGPKIPIAPPRPPFPIEPPESFTPKVLAPTGNMCDCEIFVPGYGWMPANV